MERLETEILAEAREAGLELRLEGTTLVVRGPRALSTLAREVLAHKDAIVAILAREVESPEITWRVEVMRSQVPSRGPVPVLTARAEAGPVGGCVSCGDRLSQNRKFRCAPCERAAWQVLKGAGGAGQ